MTDGREMSARLDAALVLRDADAELAAINARAGGAMGAPLTIPAVARLARLAQRLGIALERVVQIADADADLDVLVEATPGDDAGVLLTMTVLREREAWHAPRGAGAPAVAPPASDWRWQADAALRLVRVEGATRFGIDAAELLGRPLTQVFALSPRDDGTLPLLDAMAATRDFDAQPAALAATGAQVVLSGHVLCDRSGGFAGFAGGVSTSTRAADGVEDAAAPVLHARLDRLLRNPLGRIVANADSIHASSEGPLDPHYVDYAADIAAAARHLLGLVDDLADLEAIERDDFAVAEEEIDLAEIAQRAAGLLAVRAADAGVAIDRTDTQQPLPARGEFRRTLQILVNLLTNALRYSPQGSTIWLRLQRDADRAVVIVADQGKGVAAADQALIFEKFGRVDPNEPGGNGLGLYIARRLARAMGGDLAVDSAPGQGARFVLSLPAG